MVQYNYRGFILEMSLVEDRFDDVNLPTPYFRIEGTVVNHPNIFFQTTGLHDYVNSVPKRFEKWVDEMLKNKEIEELDERHFGLPVISIDGVKYIAVSDFETHKWTHSINLDTRDFPDYLYKAIKSNLYKLDNWLINDFTNQCESVLIDIKKLEKPETANEILYLLINSTGKWKEFCITCLRMKPLGYFLSKDSKSVFSVKSLLNNRPAIKRLQDILDISKEELDKILLFPI